MKTYMQLHFQWRSFLICITFFTFTTSRLSKGDFFLNKRCNFIDGDPYLFHRIPVTYGHAVIVFRIKVVGDAQGRTNFILSAIAFPDGAGFIKIYHKGATQ